MIIVTLIREAAAARKGFASFSIIFFFYDQCWYERTIVR